MRKVGLVCDAITLWKEREPKECFPNQGSLPASAFPSTQRTGGLHPRGEGLSPPTRPTDSRTPKTPEQRTADRGQRTVELQDPEQRTAERGQRTVQTQDPHPKTALLLPATTYHLPPPASRLQPAFLAREFFKHVTFALDERRIFSQEKCAENRQLACPNTTTRESARPRQEESQCGQ